MGKQFVDSIGDVAAEWSESTIRFDPNDTGGHKGLRLHKTDIPAFIEWLQAGPPKPQYRITKVFNHRPQQVWVDFRGRPDTKSISLASSDIEEIPCSG